MPVELRARGLERRYVVLGPQVGTAVVEDLEAELVLDADGVEGHSELALEAEQERGEPARELGESARGAGAAQGAVVEGGDGRSRGVEHAAREVACPDEGEGRSLLRKNTRPLSVRGARRPLEPGGWRPQRADQLE